MRGPSPALDRWLPYRKTGAVRLRIFCFPHAGGNAGFYHTLSQAFSPTIDFCPVELPGRAARISEPPITSLQTLLDRLIQVIAPLTEPPFAFFGHSNGAWIAYHAARNVYRADGAGANHLFVSARAAPGCEPGHAPLHSLSDVDLRAALRAFGATPEAVLACDDLMEAILPTLRADLALGTSKPGTGKPLDCPITVFGGTQDTIDVASLQAWRVLTTATFRLRLFEGGHFYLADNVTALAHEMASAALGLSPPVEKETRGASVRRFT
jgi:medium-chain acyl-[acyl-carrier-protein] hydrolase